jgi:CRP-like cAMP-binding protein
MPRHSIIQILPLDGGRNESNNIGMLDSSILGNYSLFDGLEKEQIDSILHLMEHEVFDAGTDIIVEGTLSNKLRVILEGQVAVVKNGIILQEFSEGDVFGEMEVLDVGPVEATIKTITPTSVITLSVDALGEIYESDLNIYAFLLMNLARDLSRRLRRMNSKAITHSPYMEWN